MELLFLVDESAQPALPVPTGDAQVILPYQLVSVSMVDAKAVQPATIMAIRHLSRAIGNVWSMC